MDSDRINTWGYGEGFNLSLTELGGMPQDPGTRKSAYRAALHMLSAGRRRLAICAVSRVRREARDRSHEPLDSR